jgi:hypothetical protein
MYYMSDRLSHQASSRTGRGNENGLSRSFLVRITKKAPDCLMGDVILSSNLAEGFLIFTDTTHHLWPFFCWNAIVRLTWASMLLCGDDRGKSAKHVLECKQLVIELSVRGNKVNQHR